MIKHCVVCEAEFEARTSEKKCSAHRSMRLETVKICRVCNNEFKAHGNAKTCAEGACRTKSRSLWRAIHYKKAKERYKARHPDRIFQQGLENYWRHRTASLIRSKKNKTPEQKARMLVRQKKNRVLFNLLRDHILEQPNGAAILTKLEALCDHAI